MWFNVIASFCTVTLKGLEKSSTRLYSHQSVPFPGHRGYIPTTQHKEKGYWVATSPSVSLGFSVLLESVNSFKTAHTWCKALEAGTKAVATF